MDTHGGPGRLLMWDSGLDWWLVNEPDVELTLICSSGPLFQEECDRLESEPFTWISDTFWTDEAMVTLEDVSRRYNLGWNR